MPELPDIETYCTALSERVVDRRLHAIQLHSPFLLRTVEPSIESFAGLSLKAVDRMGKRIAFGFSNDNWLVLHLMIAGRLHWMAAPPARPPRTLAACFIFESGCLTLTEAGTKKRAALHAVQGQRALSMHDRGGLEVLNANRSAFAAAITASRHTLKRALTDPRILSGIGNAYSDEILHRAHLSPVSLTTSLTEDQVTVLYHAARNVLKEWSERLQAERSHGFPERVTAFRDGMAVHGRFGKPCPNCQTAVQRIRYANNETNYCPRCQTGGRLLADRSLSRLLKQDWPRTIDELEQGPR
jgi:formamidopyrimidine-DNA glycosylase